MYAKIILLITTYFTRYVGLISEKVGYGKNTLWAYLPEHLYSYQEILVNDGDVFDQFKDSIIQDIISIALLLLSS
jgi:hypothetical protein